MTRAVPPGFYTAPRGVPGVDYAWSQPSIAALKSAGEVFVAQYFSADPTKNLTPARAAALRAAGIELVTIWEYSATAMLGGRAQGEADAQAAEVEARACGVDGIPIYFAADWDATPGQQGAIDAYLDGTAAVLGDDRGRNIYGGYWPLSRAKAAGKAHRLWGTIAWSGTNWVTSGLVPDIMQGAVVTIGGVSCDLDAGLSADFGQWPRPATPGAAWQEYDTDGTLSLAEVAALCYRQPASSVLRHTATKYGAFDVVVASYLNGLAGGTPWTVPIPAGGKLWLRK